MKRITEPIVGVIVSIASFEIWTNLLMSLILAFLGGAMAFWGKYLMQRTISKFNNRKNKPIK